MSCSTNPFVIQVYILVALLLVFLHDGMRRVSRPKDSVVSARVSGVDGGGTPQTTETTTRVLHLNDAMEFSSSLPPQNLLSGAQSSFESIASHLGDVASHVNANLKGPTGTHCSDNPNCRDGHDGKNGRNGREGSRGRTGGCECKYSGCCTGGSTCGRCRYGWDWVHSHTCSSLARCVIRYS